MDMQVRSDPKKVSVEGTRAMGALHKFVHQCGLERSLIELVKLRASRINRCAHCIDMHTRELRAAGETEHRISLLDTWRESPLYSVRERAALEWTEAITLVADNHASDHVYDAVRAHFTEAELVNLTLCIIAINGANRLNIAFRAGPDRV
jgi:AhpD family alkylhydroperoxidase